MITSIFKRTDNGGVEIIFTIPADIILKTKEETLNEFAKNAVVSGFRKGMAPIAKVEAITKDEELTEHILSHLLPEAFGESVITHKFSPAIYPKYDAVKITSSKNVASDTEWQIKAVTCELEKIILPKDYRKLDIKALIEKVNLKLPKMLIDEEVNARLSQVLDRIEKLGLTLEGYLKSVGKTPEILRSEYEIQAKEAISMELILNEVANAEKIEVSEKEIDEFIKTTGEDLNKVEKNQRDILKRVIMRRSALEKLSK
ncbi:MAG: Trigger factor [uncultured bacterium]|nr:MAG: Trigger factor [uncultured bacterium]